jgi:hypothetical protein
MTPCVYPCSYMCTLLVQLLLRCFWAYDMLLSTFWKRDKVGSTLDKNDDNCATSIKNLRIGAAKVKGNEGSVNLSKCTAAKQSKHDIWLALSSYKSKLANGDVDLESQSMQKCPTCGKRFVFH